MPLDINSYNDYESTRITYLKSKVVLDDKKRELRFLFEQVRWILDIIYDSSISLSWITCGHHPMVHQTVYNSNGFINPIRITFVICGNLILLCKFYQSSKIQNK